MYELSFYCTTNSLGFSLAFLATFTAEHLVFASLQVAFKLRVYSSFFLDYFIATCSLTLTVLRLNWSAFWEVKSP